MKPKRKPREAGQTLVVFVIFVTCCLMFVGVVIDAGMYYFQRREMQGTADAAALAAVRELPGSVGQANQVANDYITGQNANAKGLLQSINFSDSNRKVEVRVFTSGNSSFGKLIGFDKPEISARAVARVQMMGPRPGMLPMAFMRDAFTVGENYAIKFDGSYTGNRGAIAPDMGANCTPARGANDFSDLIKGSEYGGIDACATPIAETLDTEPGTMAGKTREGLIGRIGSNTDSYEQVFGTDPATGYQTIEMPNSPRIGIVPVVENISGGNTWPHGRSDPIRVLAYMIVYIGKRDEPGYPAYTDNGKNVWVTPVRPIIPADFEDGGFVDYDSNLPAPVAYRLVE